MAAKARQKLLKKSTTFNGKRITLFSLDGIVWSSRDWEPEKIKERQETDKVRLDNVASDDSASEEKTEVADDKSDDENYPITSAKSNNDASEKPKRGRPGKPGRKPQPKLVKPNKRETQGKKTNKKKTSTKRKAAA